MNTSPDNEEHRKMIANYVQYYAARNHAVLPATPPERGNSKTGKIPASWSANASKWCPRSNWQNDQINDPSAFIEDLAPSDLPNLGLVLGPTNLVILDFDCDGLFPPWLKKNPECYDALVVRRNNQDESGRCHVYFGLEPGQQPPSPISHSDDRGWELRSGKQFIIAPPSIHYSGGRYEFIKNGVPIPIEGLTGSEEDNATINQYAETLKTIPWKKEYLNGLPGYDPETSELVSALSTKGTITQKAKRCTRVQAVEALNHIDPEIAAHRPTWIKIGMALKSVSSDLLKEWDDFSSKAPKYKDRDDCGNEWKSFDQDGGITAGTLYHFAKESTGWEPPRKVTKETIRDHVKFNLTDSGNADRFVAVNGQRVRYLASDSVWLIWNGRYWIEDHDGGLAMGMTKHVSQNIRKEAEELEGGHYVGD